MTRRCSTSRTAPSSRRAGSVSGPRPTQRRASTTSMSSARSERDCFQVGSEDDADVVWAVRSARGAFHIDYGAAAAKYVDAFANLNGDDVNRQFEASRKAA